MSDKPGRTITIWIGEDDEALLSEFDEYFRVGHNRRSRSLEIKHAMRTHIAMHRAFEANDLSMDFNPRELDPVLRDLVTKALKYDADRG